MCIIFVYYISWFHVCCMYIYLDFVAVFQDIYHEIVRTDFLPKTANDCFFLTQEA